MVRRLRSALMKNKCAIVFGAPAHSNMGDQAQTFCTEQWLKKNYPEYMPVILDTPFASEQSYKVLDIIRSAIKPDDMIFLHSGYHTTDLWLFEEKLQRAVIARFPNFRIVVLPQTVNYLSSAEEHKSAEIYGAHQNLVFLCRDKVSYQKAQKIFPNARLFCFPDIVTTMIGKYHFQHKRNGILLCKRSDKEAKYTAEQITALIGEIERVEVTDTTINVAHDVIDRNRKGILEEIWENFSRYKLVITDRYHGTIFSLIACTPVIVIPSADHKLSSGVNWFPEEFSSYVKYIDDIMGLPEMVKEVLADNLSYELPDYFDKNYYDGLKQILEG